MSQKPVTRRCLLQRLTCYHAGVVEATARRTDQPHAAHETPDLANPVAARPPVLLDLGRDHAGDSPEPTSHP